jgi:hypothetical protein
MKKIFIIFLLLFTFSQASLISKNYNNAIGVRGLFDGGITYKQFVDNTKAFEVILSGGDKWFGLTGFYQWHNKTHAKQLEWYYGAGVHAVFIEDHKHTPWDRNTDTDLVLGVDGILGIEYSFREVPIVVSADWNPTLNLIGDSGLWLSRGSVSIRYYW